MLFTRSSSTRDCSSSTGASFTLSLGRFTVEGGGFFASSVRSSPRPSVVGSGGFSCAPGGGAGVGCGGGGEGACAFAACADNTRSRHVTAARGRVKVGNLRTG